MPGPTMTADELATEIGRTADWLYLNWRAEVANKKLPPPLHKGVRPLIWVRAHVYAFLDKDLTTGQRAIATAFRLLSDTAASAKEAKIEGDYRATLDGIYAPGSGTRNGEAIR